MWRYITKGPPNAILHNTLPSRTSRILATFEKEGECGSGRGKKKRVKKVWGNLQVETDAKKAKMSCLRPAVSSSMTESRMECLPGAWWVWVIGACVWGRG